MKRKYGDDCDRAVCQPVGNVDAKAHQEARRAADSFGLEHGQPSLRFAPAGDHVRNDNSQREERLEREVGTNHQPREDRADHDSEERYANADQQRVEQRLEQHLLGQRAAEQSLPVVQCKVASGAACEAGILLSEGERGGDHVQQREHDQVSQQHNRDQYDHVVGVGNNRLNLVFQTSGLGIVLILWFHSIKFPPSAYD